MPVKTVDVLGKTFGKLTVISREPSRILNSGKKLSRWLCKCKCGNTTVVDGRSLTSKNTKSCGCTKKDRTYWTGHEEISGSFWVCLRHNAKLRKKEVAITIQEAWDLFIKQDRKCAISGVPLQFVSNPNKNRELQTASLDRIDSSEHYTLDNVQWIHKTVNMMKNVLPQNEFFEWCQTITKHQSLQLI